MNLEKIFHPSSVAVIGASRQKRRIGHEVFMNLIRDFKGAVYAVNPNASEIEGYSCFDSILDVPHPVDLAVIVVPAQFVAEVLGECIDAGIKDVIIISAGFKEVGDEGARREQRIVELARSNEVNIVGPNSLGVISTKSGLNATFADQMAIEGNISFMSQSGAFCTAVLDWANEKGMGFNGFVSLGNKAVLDEVDMMRAWAEDPDTDVILGYLEGVSDGREFIEAAREATKTTPIVVVKSGRTEQGARAVSSHTGTLAGSERAYQAAFDQSGIIRAEDVEQFFDYATILSQQRSLEGNKVGILTNSGGPGIMATDALEKYGMDLASLSGETLEKLDEMLSPLADRNNPVDLTGDADEKDYERVLFTLLADENIESMVAISAPAAIVSYPVLADIIARGRKKFEKPIVGCLMGGEIPREARSRLSSAGVPNYFDPARAVRSLSVLYEYGNIRKRRFPSEDSPSLESSSIGDMLTKAKTEKRVQLGLESLDLLKHLGIPVVETKLARSSDEAAEFSQRVGGEVVLKICSPDISHKSDVGGVKSGIEPERAASAYSEMIENVSRCCPEARIEGAHVQRMVEGTELIVGMNRDDQFGPLVMFGLGGIFVEVVEDISFKIPPVSTEDVRDMITSIRGYPLLEGLRGREEVDIEQLIDIIKRVSQLGLEFPQINEIDINPLIAGPSGIYAVDFRASLGI